VLRSGAGAAEPRRLFVCFVEFIILRTDTRVPSATTNCIMPVNDVLTVHVYRFYHSILCALLKCGVTNPSATVWCKGKGKFPFESANCHYASVIHTSPLHHTDACRRETPQNVSKANDITACYKRRNAYQGTVGTATQLLGSTPLDPTHQTFSRTTFKTTSPLANLTRTYKYEELPNYESEGCKIEM
jgi:hypothetical protein